MSKMRIYARFRKRVGWENRGQSLVETALVIPVLTIILIGGAELAQVMRTSITVSNAAKAGAQYASQNGYTASDATGITNAANAESQGLTLTTDPPSISCVCSDGTVPPSNSCANTDCPNAHIEETVTVSTSATITPVVHLPGLPATWTIKGKSIQRCMQ